MALWLFRVFAVIVIAGIAGALYAARIPPGIISGVGLIVWVIIVTVVVDLALSGRFSTGN
jgi:hypothetical protein